MTSWSSANTDPVTLSNATRITPSTVLLTLALLTHHCHAHARLAGPEPLCAAGAPRIAMSFLVHRAAHDHAVAASRLARVTREKAAGVACLLGVRCAAGVVEGVAKRFRGGIDAGVRGLRAANGSGSYRQCHGNLQRSPQHNSTG